MFQEVLWARAIAWPIGPDDKSKSFRHEPAPFQVGRDGFIQGNGGCLRGGRPVGGDFVIERASCASGRSRRFPHDGRGWSSPPTSAEIDSSSLIVRYDN
jgi:hypothetical protein